MFSKTFMIGLHFVTKYMTVNTVKNYLNFKIYYSNICYQIRPLTMRKIKKILNSYFLNLLHRKPKVTKMYLNWLSAKYSSDD